MNKIINYIIWIAFGLVIIGLINMDKSHGDSEVNKIIEKLLQVKGLKV